MNLAKNAFRILTLGFATLTSFFLRHLKINIGTHSEVSVHQELVLYIQSKHILLPPPTLSWACSLIILHLHVLSLQHHLQVFMGRNFVC